MSRLYRIRELIAEMAPSVLFVSFLLIIVCLVYAPVTQLNFSRPDDHWHLLNFDLVHPEQFDLDYLYTVFTTFNSIQYSPLNTLYFYLIYNINGYDPYFFHLGSFIIHVLNIYLIFLLCKKILLAFDIEKAEKIAYVVCFIWAIHPFNVESVAWISASKIPLFSFFALLSMYYFILGIERSKLRFYFPSTVYLILSCFAKEQAIVTPFVLIGFLLCFQLHKGHKVGANKKAIWFLIIQVIISIAFAYISFKANAPSNMAPIRNYTFFEQIILSFHCLNFYFTNLVVPINLHYNYKYPFKPGESPFIGMYLYPLVLLLFFTLTFFFLRGSKEKFFYIFCVIFFFANIGLMLQIVPMTRRVLVADRFMYLPIIPLLLVAFTLIFKQKKRTIKIAAISLMTLLTLFYCTYSYQLILNWVAWNF